jgi:hypothetical protein
MAQEADAIKQHIDAQRERLGENLQRLEHEVKKAADWRIWVERKPLVALGVAFAGGLWLATRGSSR